ncbi:hypothetical protein Moror_6721 [Moniliophthora roreri MCA 2997]|uniref:F-box domain-containing protein n=1 Tax=Moniliophthora roreri (strain MCA 2997) TaxID=1381753 RepID=V2YYD8_MONRO|nr:hypothetical protein Moror_6721 [Moniliophthora roreri MCA 2997]
MPLLSLPSDLLLELVSHLEVLDAYYLSLTCRCIRNLSLDQHAYWAEVLVNSQQLLPFPQHEDVRSLSREKLRKLVLRVVTLENNLHSEEPLLKQPTIRHDLSGQLANHTRLINIPGTPIMILGCKEIECIDCFDYIHGRRLSSTAFTGHLHAISAPFHEYGKTTVVVQIASGILDHNPALHALTVKYALTGDGETWTVQASFNQVPGVRMDPMAGLPVMAICTDADVAAYTLPLFEGDGDPGYLKVAAHEISTGRTTTITTDLVIGVDVNDYVLTLKNRELFIIREDKSFTCIWTIPSSLLPYHDNAVEALATYKCVSNPHYHGYEVADHSSLFANIITHTHTSNSIRPDIQATLVSSETALHAWFQYRRWTLPGARSQRHFASIIPFIVESPEACDGPQISSSLSSLLYMARAAAGRKRKVPELRLLRFHERSGRAHVTHHKLQTPKDLDSRKVANLIFDEGLGVALVLLFDGTLYVLRYGAV